MPSCHQCGAKSSSSHTFCSRCGAQLHQSETEDSVATVQVTSGSQRTAASGDGSGRLRQILVAVWVIASIALLWLAKSRGIVGLILIPSWCGAAITLLANAKLTTRIESWERKLTDRQARMKGQKGLTAAFTGTLYRLSRAMWAATNRVTDRHLRAGIWAAGVAYSVAVSLAVCVYIGYIVLVIAIAVGLLILIVWILSGGLHRPKRRRSNGGTDPLLSGPPETPREAISRKQQDHNDGQAAGSQAGWLDEVVERTNPLSSQEYKKGFDHGLTQKPKTQDKE
jgi:hypothetical protein